MEQFYTLGEATMRKTAAQVPIGGPANLEPILVAEPVIPESPREQRKAALKKVFGIFKGRDDAPQDGLAFQLDIRADDSGPV